MGLALAEAADLCRLLQKCPVLSAGEVGRLQIQYRRASATELMVLLREPGLAPKLEQYRADHPGLGQAAVYGIVVKRSRFCIDRSLCSTRPGVADRAEVCTPTAIDRQARAMNKIRIVTLQPMTPYTSSPIGL